jgi:hypothetical protein
VGLVSLSVLIVRAKTIGEDIYSNIEENNGLLRPSVLSREVHASIAQTGDTIEKPTRRVRSRKIREKDVREISMK